MEDEIAHRECVQTEYRTYKLTCALPSAVRGQRSAGRISAEKRMALASDYDRDSTLGLRNLPLDWDFERFG